MAAPPDGYIEMPDTSMPPMEESIWTSTGAGVVGLSLLGAALIWLAGRSLNGLFGKDSPWRDGR